jgi:hypothetical protein
MGDNAFNNADAMMEGISAVAQIPGAGSVSTQNLTFENSFDYCNPYYLTNPPPVNYDARTAEIDTALTRTLLEKAKLSQEKIGDHEELRVDPVEYNTHQYKLTLADWEAYVQSEKYFVVCRNLKVLSMEMGTSDYLGVTTHLDAFPTEDGGTSAVITLYAGIRANSPNKLNAINMIKNSAWRRISEKSGRRRTMGLRMAGAQGCA